MELAAFAGFALHIDRAAHCVHNIFCDRHAQAAALCPADAGVVLAHKGLKDTRLELRRHPDPAVLYTYMDLHVILADLGRLLVHGNQNPSFLRREFDRVGEQV